MNKMIDLTGQRFGRLTVLELAPDAGYFCTNKAWKARCDCGEEVIVLSHNLRSGQTRSCGCLRRDMLMARRKGVPQHG